MNQKVLDGIAFWAVVAYLVHRGYQAQQERKALGQKHPININMLAFYKSIKQKLIDEEFHAASDHR